MGSRNPLLSLVGNLEPGIMDEERRSCSSGAEENCQTQCEERRAFGSPLEANRKDSRATCDLSSSGYPSVNLDVGPCCLSDMEINIGKRHNRSNDLHALGCKRARQDNCCSGSIPRPRDGEADTTADQLFGGVGQISFAEPVGNTKISNALNARDLPGIEICGMSSNSSSNDTGASLEKPNHISFVLPELLGEHTFPPQHIQGNQRSDESNLEEGTPLPFYDNYFRKPVLLGPNHQVDVPPMDSSKMKYIAKSSDKFVGTCVIPMPDADASNPSTSSVNLGDNASHCCCADRGSIRCIRLHVTEAREHAKIMFGPEKFSQLGFCDMGEDVAERWTAEEERLFREVVYANPASVGKTFWKILPRYFTTRNRKELVSYYYNVFMLRKRAGQNQFDPHNTDSDNDEWQDDVDDHYTMDGAGAYSHASPICPDDAYVTDPEEDEECSSDEDDKKSCDYFDVASESSEHGSFNLCDENDCDKEICEHTATAHESNQSRDFNLLHRSIIAYKSGLIPGEPTVKRSEDIDDNDAHGNSLTLFQGGHCGVCTPAKRVSVSSAQENGDLSACSNVQERKSSLNIATEHGYISGPCDSKTWDVGYFAGSAKVVEFLPTCYVIEEVFGKENCDNVTNNGPSITKA